MMNTGPSSDQREANSGVSTVRMMWGSHERVHHASSRTNLNRAKQTKQTKKKKQMRGLVTSTFHEFRLIPFLLQDCYRHY